MQITAAHFISCDIVFSTLLITLLHFYIAFNIALVEMLAEFQSQQAANSHTLSWDASGTYLIFYWNHIYIRLSRQTQKQRYSRLSRDCAWWLVGLISMSCQANFEEKRNCSNKILEENKSKIYLILICSPNFWSKLICDEILKLKKKFTLKTKICD